MIIDHLKMVNFIPYYGDVTVEFPRDSFSNMVVFHGENTKGKTSILNAFRWVLYEEAGKKGKPLLYDDLLNRRAKKEGQSRFEVELAFSSAGDKYVLSRTQTSSDPSSTKALMTKNGEPVDADTLRREIERIAPVGTSRFFLFDGELLSEYEELLQASSSTAKKIKAAIEDVMGFPSLKNTLSALENVEDKLKVRAADDKTASAVVAQLRDKRNQIADEIKGIKAELDHLQKSETETQDALAEISESVESSRDLGEFIANFRAKENEIENLNELILTETESQRSTKEEAWKSLLQEKLSTLAMSARTDLETRTSIQEQVAIKQGEVRVLSQLNTSDTCPTCLQPSSEAKTVSTRLQSSETELALLLERLSTSKDPSSVLDAERLLNAAISMDRLKESEQNLQRLEFKKVRASADLKELRDKIEDFDQKTLSDRERERDRNLKRKFELEQALNNIANAVGDCEKRLSERQSEELNLSEKIGQNSQGQGDVNESALLLCQQLKKIFEQTKSVLRDEIKSNVGERAQDAFLNMTSRVDDYAGLRITDSYGLEIITSDGDVLPNRSAGAEQVVALALIDGLNKVGRSPGPVLMDTPFGRLDETHRRRILEYMPSSARQFAVFVHSGELKEDSEVMATIRPRIGKQYRISSGGPDYSFLEQM